MSANFGGDQAEVAEIRAELATARWSLEKTTVLAPGDGWAINVQIRPGSFAAALPLRPVMTVVMKDQQVYMLYTQNELRAVVPGNEAEYAYLSTFHWLPLVNGYSGVYPPSYLARLGRLLDFPSERALAQLRRDHVTYVIVHGSAYPEAQFNDLRLRIQLGGALVELGAFDDAKGRAVLYRLP